MIALATLLVGVSLGLPSFAAAWATPGAACTQEGANANSDGFLTCTGGVWVSNAVLMGTTSATCDSTKAGYIRYTGGQFEGCNGTGWIQLAGGRPLKVYSSDGVTVVGNYLGTLNAADILGNDTCAYTLYADETTGVVKQLSTYECNMNASGDAYFSGANCTGTTYIQASTWGFCCTGSGICTTNRCMPAGGTSSTHAYSSRRQNGNGLCVNGSSSIVGSYPTKANTCGDGPCLVK